MSAVQTQLIDGKARAGEIREAVAVATAELTQEHGLAPPVLAVVLVGDDPASQVYVGNKGKAAERAGLGSRIHRLPASTRQAELLTLVKTLNADPAVRGILVQLPLPGHIDSAAVIDAIDPLKDVDGFHWLNAGALATGSPRLVPCTPLGCLDLLRRHYAQSAGRTDLAGLTAVVIGRSNIVGKPMARLLLRHDATVTIAHSKSPDLPAICAAADILIPAVGRAHMVGPGWVKPGAVVIDVGINRLTPEPGQEKGRLTGDADFLALQGIAGAITPVPGGVGPMTIACLLANTVRATCLQTGFALPSVLASLSP